MQVHSLNADVALPYGYRLSIETVRFIHTCSCTGFALARRLRTGKVVPDGLSASLRARRVPVDCRRLWVNNIVRVIVSLSPAEVRPEHEEVLCAQAAAYIQLVQIPKEARCTADWTEFDGPIDPHSGRRGTGRNWKELEGTGRNWKELEGIGRN